jgi:hypothetical protein
MMCKRLDPTFSLVVLDYPFEYSGEMLNLIKSATSILAYIFYSGYYNNVIALCSIYR